MVKNEILSQLRSAKSAHIQWRAYAQAIVAGLPVEQNHVPVIYTNCAFGKWYYGNGQRLSFLSSYAGLEAPHQVLHETYTKIFKLLFGEDDRSMLKKMFGSSSKIKKEHQREAEELLTKLVGISETLLEAISVLEAEVKDLTDEELAAA